jgi:catechol 2,3-dioxygenase-like lactoylglutathione lyase family enzyme
MVLARGQEERWAVIHHVQLACPPGTEEALRAFYGGVLGLDEVAKPPALAARGGCWFSGHGLPASALGVCSGCKIPE